MSSRSEYFYTVEQIVEELELPDEIKGRIINTVGKILHGVNYIVEKVGDKTYINVVPIFKHDSEALEFISQLNSLRLEVGTLFKVRGSEVFQILPNSITLIPNLQQQFRNILTTDGFKTILERVCREGVFPCELVDRIVSRSREYLDRGYAPFTSIVEGVKTTLDESRETLQAAARVGNALSTCLENLDTCIEDIVKAVVRVLLSILFSILSPVQQLFQNVINNVTNFFNNLLNWFNIRTEASMEYNFSMLPAIIFNPLITLIFTLCGWRPAPTYDPNVKQVSQVVNTSGDVVTPESTINIQVFGNWREGDVVRVDIACVPLDVFLRHWDEIVQALREGRPITWSLVLEREYLLYGFGYSTTVRVTRDGVVEIPVGTPVNPGKWVIAVDVYKTIYDIVYSKWIIVIVGDETRIVKTPIVLDPDEESAKIKFNLTNMSNEEVTLRITVHDLESNERSTGSLVLAPGESREVTIDVYNLTEERDVKIVVQRVIAERPGSLDVTSVLSIDVVRVIPKRVAPARPEVPRVTNIQLNIQPATAKVCENLTAYATFYFEHACVDDFRKTVDIYVNDELAGFEEVLFRKYSDVQTVEATLHFNREGTYNVKICCREDNVCSNVVSVNIQPPETPPPQVDIVEITLDKEVYTSGENIVLNVRIRSEETYFRGRLCVEDWCREYSECKDFEIGREEKTLQFILQAPEVTEETTCHVGIRLYREEVLLRSYVITYRVMPRPTPPPTPPTPPTAPGVPSVEAIDLVVIDPQPWIYCPILDAVTVRVSVTVSEPVAEDTTYKIYIHVKKGDKIVKTVEGNIVVTKDSTIGTRDFVIRNILTIGKVSIYATCETQEITSQPVEIEILPPIICRAMKIIQKGKIYGETEKHSTR